VPDAALARVRRVEEAVRVLPLAARAWRLAAPVLR
jgi:hypothetical protein